MTVAINPSVLATLTVTPPGSMFLGATLGGTLCETPIAPASGTSSVATVAGASPSLPYAVGASRLVAVEVEAMFSCAAGRVWNGTLAATAKRVGSGALVVTSQVMGIPLELSDSAWDPRIVANGNSLELCITADSAYAITPRGRVRVVEVDTSGDEQLSALGAARLLVAEDANDLVIYSDVGLTPAAPSVGDYVSVWADQSGNGHDVTFAAGNRPKYALDGTIPALDFLTADQALGTSNFVPPQTGAKVFRWTMTSFDDAASVELIWFTNANLYVAAHCAGSSIGAGTHLGLNVNSTVYDLGVRPSGQHDYELVLDGASPTAHATLYVDGVGREPVAISEPGAALGTLSIGGFNGSQWSLNSRVFGAAYKSGVATESARAHWIAMSQIAWGPHD